MSENAEINAFNSSRSEKRADTCINSNKKPNSSENGPKINLQIKIITADEVDKPSNTGLDSDSGDYNSISRSSELFSTPRRKSSSKNIRKRHTKSKREYSKQLDSNESSASDIEFNDDVHGKAEVSKVFNNTNDINDTKNKIMTIENGFFNSDADAEPPSISESDSSLEETPEIVEPLKEKEEIKVTDPVLPQKEEDASNISAGIKVDDEISILSTGDNNLPSPKTVENQSINKETIEDKPPQQKPDENSSQNNTITDVSEIISSIRNFSNHTIRKEKPAFPMPSQQKLEQEILAQKMKAEKEEEIPEKIGGICLYRVQTPEVDEEKNYGLQKITPQISIPFPDPTEINDESHQETEQKNITSIEKPPETAEKVKEEPETVDFSTYQSIQFPHPSIVNFLDLSDGTNNHSQHEGNKSIPRKPPKEPNYSLQANKSPRRGKDMYRQTAEKLSNMQCATDRESAMLQNMKQLAMNQQPLPNVPDTYFAALIEQLANDKYDFIQKRLFEEASCFSRALDFAQNERTRIRKETLFQDAQNQHRHNIEQLQRDIDHFNAESEALYSQLQSEQNAQRERLVLQHDAEMERLMDVWSSEQKLRLYNRASALLVQSRNQLQILVENSRFDEAKVLQQRIHELEERERRESHTQMQRDFDIAAQNLKRRQEQEMEAFESRVEQQNQQFIKKRKQARVPLESRQKRIEAEGFAVSDPEKVWNRNQMQQREETVAIMLSRNSLPQSRPFTRGNRQNTNTMISLPPLDMSKGRKMAKSRLPPLSGVQ